MQYGNRSDQITGTVDPSKRSEGGRKVLTFLFIYEKVWGGCLAVKIIFGRKDTSKGTNDEGTRENDTEEKVSLNSSGEKMY